MSDWDDNMGAISSYMTSKDAVTSESVKLKDSWITWFNGISWYARNVTPGEQALYDEARNRRNAFNIANAATGAEKTAAQRVAKTGFTTEEQAGEAKRVLSTGRFPIASKPFIPPEYKLAAIIIGVGIVLVTAYGFATAIPAALLSGKLLHKKTEPKAGKEP